MTVPLKERGRFCLRYCDRAVEHGRAIAGVHPQDLAAESPRAGLEGEREVGRGGRRRGGGRAVGA